MMTIEAALIVAVGSLASVIVWGAAQWLAERKGRADDMAACAKERQAWTERLFAEADARRRDQVAAAEAIGLLKSDMHQLIDEIKGRH